jgi:hypothetical protein
MEPYRYRLLAPGDIRLLRLLPAVDEAAAIKCHLFDFTLGAGRGTDLYEALSYVWGDVNEGLPIEIDEQALNVTKNLHAALVHMRHHYMERLIWVDAICINQTDENEKVQQIQDMYRIYALANSVLVWLGEEADGSEQAFQEIYASAARGSTVAASEHGNLRSIFALLNRPWFQRVWVRNDCVVAMKC